jgi:hypothetical protein
MTANFNLDNYVTVNERIQAFWQGKSSPPFDGRIVTYLEHLDPPEIKNRMCVIRAEIYQGDKKEPISTGIAKEREGTMGANKTAFMENAETSAIGRALANLGVLVERERPSREEMETVQAIEEAHANALAEIKTIGLESDDEDLKAKIRANWEDLKLDPVQATEFLFDLKDALYPEEEMPI